MPPERDAAYLWDMLSAARAVVDSVQALTLEQYLADDTLRLATERRIEIIGEAARRVSDGYKEAHPEIPWRLIVDQRNVLIHSYDEVVDERIWKLARKEVPDLVASLQKLVQESEL